VSVCVCVVGEGVRALLCARSSLVPTRARARVCAWRCQRPAWRALRRSARIGVLGRRVAASQRGPCAGLARRRAHCCRARARAALAAAAAAACAVCAL
jgi:hypothetical protein